MNPSDPLQDAISAWASLAGGLTRGPTPGSSPLDAVLMQAHVASSGALLRSGQRATQSWLTYTQEAAAGSELSVQVEAARGHLRRLAEISADEARQIEQQMRSLDEQLRAQVAPVPGGTDPVRRAQAKP
jgi:hypothetical protein